MNFFISFFIVVPLIRENLFPFFFNLKLVLFHDFQSKHRFVFKIEIPIRKLLIFDWERGSCYWFCVQCFFVNQI